MTALLVGMTMVTAAGVLAASFFWQRLPNIPGSGSGPASASIVPNCDPLVASPSTVPIGSSGSASFYCATNSAFTVSPAMTAVPWFETEGFNPPYTALWLYDSAGAILTGPCAGRTGAIALSHNVPVTIPAGSWNYCADFDTVGSLGLNAFAIGWYDRPCVPADNCGDELP